MELRLYLKVISLPILKLTHEGDRRLAGLPCTISESDVAVNEILRTHQQEVIDDIAVVAPQLLPPVKKDNVAEVRPLTSKRRRCSSAPPAFRNISLPAKVDSVNPYVGLPVS